MTFRRKEDNMKVILRKENKRENVLKIAAVGSDGERIKRVLRHFKEE